MATATGSFRLDPASARFFGAMRFHFVVREGVTIVGRYGRHGSVTASLSDRRAIGVWREVSREGWFTIGFDERFECFEGEYGIGIAPAGPESGRPIAGARPRRARAR